MTLRRSLILFVNLLILSVSSSCSSSLRNSSLDSLSSLQSQQEIHFRSLKQLTRSGRNSGSSWSPDGKKIVFQKERFEPEKKGFECSRIYQINKDGSDPIPISPPDQEALYPSFGPNSRDVRIVFSANERASDKCISTSFPGSAWSVKNWILPARTQVYGALTDGTDLIQLEAGAPRGYHSEVSFCGARKAVFSSDRLGDVQIFLGDVDSMGSFSKVLPITSEVGYHGQPSFSPICGQIAWSGYEPKSKKEKISFRRNFFQKALTLQGAEIWISSADGTHQHQITRLGGMNLHPVFTPDGKKILFASNFENAKTHLFHLYLIDLEGSNLERITFAEGSHFDPAFSRDGTYVTFSSTRNATEEGEVNIFRAEWKSNPQ